MTVMPHEEESGGVVKKRGYDCYTTRRGEWRSSDEEGL